MTTNGNGLVKSLEEVNLELAESHFNNLPKDKPFQICSDSLSNIVKSLIKAKFNFEKIGKSADNPYYKSKFASLDVVYSAVQPALLDQGIFINCTVSDNNYDSVKLKVKVKSEVEEIAHFVRTFRVVLLHESGEYIGSEVPFYVNPNDPQKTGISFTYLQRYIIGSLLSLVIEEDDDGNSASGINPYNLTIGDNQLSYLQSQIKTPKNPDGTVDPEKVKILRAKYNISKLSELPKSKYEEFLVEFESLKSNTTVEKENVNLSEFISKETYKLLQQKRKNQGWDVNRVKETLNKLGIQNDDFKNIPLNRYDEVLAELEKLNDTVTPVEE